MHLPSRLASLRAECCRAMDKPADMNARESQETLIRHCVQGPALDTQQAKTLSELGLHKIAQIALGEEQRLELGEWLDGEDQERLLSFFTDGPKPTW